MNRHGIVPAWTVGAAIGLALLLTFAAMPLAAGQVSPDKKPEDLKSGEWVWNPEASPSGPVVVVVSITEQRAYVYRNGILIAYTLVATGKSGHETPTGVFTVLEKDKDHVSSLYNAKMPYTERLTWTGICLHAGSIPGYPNSHGCIHLPLEFSKLLYELDAMGTTVVIANDHSGPAEAAHPGMVLSPLLHEPEGPVVEKARFRWEPALSSKGPVSLLLSTADRQLYVYRSGQEIGVAEVHLSNPEKPLIKGVFTVLEGAAQGESPFASGRPMHRWMGFATSTEAASHVIDAAMVTRIHIPQDFGEHVYGILSPGSTLLITDRAATPQTTTDADFVIMATHHEEKDKAKSE